MQIAPWTAAAPTFTGGIDHVGAQGSRFTAFSAHATDVVVGDAAGYGDLQSAIDALTMATVGARLPAAGVFEADGRFYGRQLDNKLTFATGATWEGVWRLEQYPADLALVTGAAAGTTRSESLRAVVDGAQRVVVTALPVGSTPA